MAPRRGLTRQRAAWAISGVWCLGMMLLTGGLGDALSDDARTTALLVGAALASITVTLTAGRPDMPAWVLWSGPGSPRSARARLLKPLVPGALAAIAAAAGAYVGLGWSVLRSAVPGLGFGPGRASPYVDWSLPLVAAVAGVLAGSLFVMALVLPIGAALDARRQWHTDRPEALHRLAFAGAWLGFCTAAAGFIVAHPTPPEMGTGAQPRSVERTLADLRDFANVLLGGSPQAPVSSTGAWIARAGTVLLLASLILHWRPRWKAMG